MSKRNAKDFAIDTITENSIKITWDFTGSEDENESLNIKYGTDGSNFDQSTGLFSIFDASGNTHTYFKIITGLTANTEYYFTFFNKTNMQYNPDNIATIVSGITAPSPPTVPTNLSCTVLSPTSITVDWDANSNSNDRVYYSTSNTVWSNYETVSGNTFTFTTLLPNTKYYFKIIGTNRLGATSDPSSTVDATTLPTPPPTNFAVTTGTITQTQITTTWTLPTIAPDSYNIYQKTSAAQSYTQITNTIKSTDTTYTFTGLTAGTTYTFKIEAVLSTVASTAVTATGRTLTPPPTNFAVTTGTITQTQITTTWTPPTIAPDSYNIYQKTSAAQSYTQITNTIKSTDTTYTFTGLTAGTTYTFKIEAVLSTVASTAVTATGTTLSGSTAPPTNLTSTRTSTSITLNWKAGVAGCSYKLFKKLSTTSSFSGTADQTVANNTNSDGTPGYTYTFTGLTWATTYNFQIIAVKNSVDSTAVTNTTATLAASPPTNFTVSSSTPAGSTANGTITCTWTRVDTPTSYKVFRSLTDSNYTQVTATISTSATSYTFTGLSANTKYYFQLVAVYGTTNSTPIKTNGTTVAQPSNFKQTAATATTATCTWTKVGTPSSYKVYRSTTTNFTTATPITVASTLLTYTFTGLTANTQYYFQIIAFVGTSNQSIPVIITGSTVLPPLNFKQTAATATTAICTWTKAGTPSSYKVYRSTTTNFATATPITVASNLATYTFTGLTANTQYYFQIIAFFGTASIQSIPVIITGSTVIPPTAFAKSTVTTNSVKLTWTKATATPDNYLVYRSTTTSFTTSITVASSLATYTFTGLTTKTNYYFQIVAVKGGKMSIPVTISTPIRTSIKESPTFLLTQPPHSLPSVGPRSIELIQVNGTANFTINVQKDIVTTSYDLLQLRLVTVKKNDIMQIVSHVHHLTLRNDVYSGNVPLLTVETGDKIEVALINLEGLRNNTTYTIAYLINMDYTMP